MMKTFSGELDFLSNFYPAKVVVGGLRYRCAEAAYQAQKSLDASVREKFTEYHGGKSKRKARKIAVRADWYDVRLAVMEEVVRAKFTQNARLAVRLVATGTMPLEEGNTWGGRILGH